MVLDPQKEPHALSDCEARLRILCHIKVSEEKLSFHF